MSNPYRVEAWRPLRLSNIAAFATAALLGLGSGGANAIETRIGHGSGCFALACASLQNDSLYEGATFGDATFEAASAGKLAIDRDAALPRRFTFDKAFDRPVRNVDLRPEEQAVPGRRVDPHVLAVPEPETYALFMAGLAAVGFMARRRKT